MSDHTDSHQRALKRARLEHSSSDAVKSVESEQQLASEHADHSEQLSQLPPALSTTTAHPDMDNADESEDAEEDDESFVLQPKGKQQ